MHDIIKRQHFKCRKPYFWHWIIPHIENTLIVKIFILSLQLVDLFRWIDSSVACMGYVYSLEVRVILACELHYSPSLYRFGWHFAKLQIADCKLPAFFLPGPKLPKLRLCSFNMQNIKILILQITGKEKNKKEKDIYCAI